MKEAPMGSPISPAIDNLSMGEFEVQALETQSFQPKLWLRYFDDILGIVPNGQEHM